MVSAFLALPALSSLPIQSFGGNGGRRSKRIRKRRAALSLCPPVPILGRHLEDRPDRLQNGHAWRAGRAGQPCCKHGHPCSVFILSFALFLFFMLHLWKCSRKGAGLVQSKQGTRTDDTSDRIWQWPRKADTLCRMGKRKEKRRREIPSSHVRLAHILECSKTQKRCVKFSDVS